MKRNITSRKIRNFKFQEQLRKLSMLTCYDFQTAQSLSDTEVDMLLVGDSLGNVVLGFETTLEVTTQHMEIFCQAVRRGAPNKFIVCDVPFEAITEFSQTISTCVELFKNSKADALKIEGAKEFHQKVIRRLTELGIPVMGHIGLQPQSVHGQGGYFTHGKNEYDQKRLRGESKDLETAGCFSIVLECVSPVLTQEITSFLEIPTIGIGSGEDVDGQVLVINDLLGSTKGKKPFFVDPIDNFHERKLSAANRFLKSINNLKTGVNDGPNDSPYA